MSKPTRTHMSSLIDISNPMFKKCIAVGLYVQDFAKSYKFYKEILGMSVKTADHKNDFAELQIGNYVFALLNNKTIDGMVGMRYVSENKKQSFVLAVEVDSVGETIKRLKAQNVEVIVDPKTTPWGQKVAYFRDINGYIWEVSESFDE